MKQKKNPKSTGRENEGNFDEEYWRKGTNHEPNNLKLQTNKKQKTSNNKHKQPTLKLDQSQMTKTQKQKQARTSL